MVKGNPRQKQPIPSSQSKMTTPQGMAFQLGYDPTGKQEPVDIEGFKEGWSEYTLADGSIIRVKAVLLDVKRLVGKYDAAGDPVYVIQSALVNQVKSPENLKKKG